MCLSIPVRVESVDGVKASGEIGGASMMIRLDLLPDTKVGDYVLVHSGYAIEKLDEEFAQGTLSLLNEMMNDEMD
jgi:hydrogenase expression/formation protein HypC